MISRVSSTGNVLLLTRRSSWRRLRSSCAFCSESSAARSTSTSTRMKRKPSVRHPIVFDLRDETTTKNAGDVRSVFIPRNVRKSFLLRKKRRSRRRIVPQSSRHTVRQVGHPFHVERTIIGIDTVTCIATPTFDTLTGGKRDIAQR